MKQIKSEAYGYLKDMFSQHHMIKRVVLSFISIIIMGLGISFFSVSGFGVDPFTSMNMNIAGALGLGFGTYQLIVNFAILLFVIIVAHRGLVGVGTAFNMVFCGYSCEFFESIFRPMVESNNTLAVRIPLLIAGILILCFACSLFFTASIKLDYKWVTVITGITVILVGLVISGGLACVLNGDFSKIHNIGIGTIITAFCMGPVINVFNKYVSAKIFNIDYEKISKDVAFFMIKGAMVKNSAPRNIDTSKIEFNPNPYKLLEN